MRVGLEFFQTAENGPLAIGVAIEGSDQALSELFADLIEAFLDTGAGWAFNQKIIAVEQVVLAQP